MTRALRPAALVALLLAAPAAGRAEIYACVGDAIRVFDDAATSNDAPVRVIQSALLAECYGIALDNLHDEIWAGTGTTVSVFRASADGTVAPLRTIGGDASGLVFVVSVAVDVEADEVYVGNSAGQVFVFPRGADGNVAPLRKLSGPLTELVGVLTVFVDRVHDELYVADFNESQVVVFDRTATGNVEPTRAPLTAVGTTPFGLFVDPRAGELFVAAADPAVETFDLVGNSLRTIAGAQSQIDIPYGLTLTSEGRLLVGSQEPTAADPDPILGFARELNGDAVPAPHLLLGAPANRSLWGIVSSRALACGEGNVVSFCLFRDGFERGDPGNWSQTAGEIP
jgi:hypothetical protein